MAQITVERKVKHMYIGLGTVLLVLLILLVVMALRRSGEGSRWYHW